MIVGVMATQGPILLIEDDADIREAMGEYLEASGYTVVTAGDGKVGLEVLRRERPAVVILDMHLPLIDGSRVLQSLRSMTGLSDVPVIIVTGGQPGMTQRTAAQYATALNVQQIFVKPVEMAKVLAAVQRFARSTSAAAGPPALP